jgi:hypothetical protein
VRGEERHGDGAIRLLLEARVHGTQHLAQALPALCRDARIGRRRWGVPKPPIPGQRLQSVGGSLVEEDERGAGRSRIGSADEARADSLAVDFNAGIREARWLRPLRARLGCSPRRQRLQDQRPRIDRRRPGGFCVRCGKVGVDRERITPIC